MNVLGRQVEVIRVERRRDKSEVLIELNGVIILGMDHQSTRGNDRLGL
ncbi:hypothetical protein [Georgfuchsia toluolica]|nr:hypothetical protein [Georgfuchsia toluolica]